MKAWLSLSLDELRNTTPDRIAEQLNAVQTTRFATSQLTQLMSWRADAAALQQALQDAPFYARLVFEYDLLRLEKRIDAVLVTDRAIFVLEFKVNEPSAMDLRQVEDYARDLHDFHSASRHRPIVPILVARNVKNRFAQTALPFNALTKVVVSDRDKFGIEIAQIYRQISLPSNPIDILSWEDAPYRPVMTVLDAAMQLYRRNSVADIAEARADTSNLNLTFDAIAEAIRCAERDKCHIVIFVTGIPGAGKTLCGLNVAFGALRESGAAFLSGNVPLIKVLREALARDVALREKVSLNEARRKPAHVLQNVHKFLDDFVVHPGHEPEAHIIVFDEAQRAWDAKQAIKDTQRRVSQLSDSEPAHALEIMGRFKNWSVIVALIGQGQEINTGEAGLAEWGRVIAESHLNENSTRWSAIGAERVIKSTEPSQRLANDCPDWLDIDPRLDLTVPIRSVRDAAGAGWVEALIKGDQTRATQIAEDAGGVGFFVTRDLDAARAAIRRLTPGLRRGGLVATAGAKRLRAEGLGVQLQEVEDWFLNRWDDVRSSEALETFATEYDCQGLELDVVGLAWGGDLIRSPHGWQQREFKGKSWNLAHKAERRRFILNKYRVLLTRARYETIIWVPPGSPTTDPFHDTTRPASEMDAIAAFLLACGACPISPSPTSTLSSDQAP
jgi:hypothetical protein